MTFGKFMTATAVAALLAVPASAQMWDGYDRNTGYDGFNSGFNEMGYHDAWDRDADGMLNEREFSTGLYADWDTDNDVRITEVEYTRGAERWYGADYDGDFDLLDEEGTGYLDQNEWGSNWNNEYFTSWDGDNDGFLTADEYSTGVYNTADLDRDQYISIEEEGWFEGWFDGDDIEAEVREVGDTW